MDFGLLPPEINSGRMYSGPGSSPLLAAAAAWDALAGDLRATAAGYDSAITELSTGWSGPSATAMASAASPHAKWLHAAAVHAEQTAAQANSAAAAYETAFAMTVPPPVIAANRTQLMTLLATNFLGQNAPAIAATEAHYAEMWAQDATAMYNYAGNAAAAAQLTPFTPPPQITALTQAVPSLAAPVTNSSTVSASALAAVLAPAVASAPAIEVANAGLEVIVDSIGTFVVDALGTFVIEPIGVAGIAESLILEGLGGSMLPVSASLAGAAEISGLSVPQAWTMAAPALIQHVGLSLPATGAATTSAGPAAAIATPFAAITAAGLAGRASATTGRSAAGAARQRRPPPDPPTEQSSRWVRPIMGIDLELLELAELRAAGILTDEEYAGQTRRLRYRG